MTAIQMPHKIDLLKEAKLKRELAYSLSLESLERVLESAPGSVGAVDVTVNCQYDGDGHPFMALHVETVLALKCQRCLEPFLMRIESDQRIVAVETEALAREVPEGLEPVVSQDGTIDLIAVVEDEILLAIPMHPKHTVRDCNVTLATPESIQEERQTPFAGLDKLLEAEQAE